jgi:hypothetical protein
MTRRVEVHQTIAGREEEFWISRERVPMDGFASETIPASDGLPMAYWNIEGVLARIAAGEEPACRRGVILQGQI